MGLDVAATASLLLAFRVLLVKVILSRRQTGKGIPPVYLNPTESFAILELRNPSYDDREFDIKKPDLLIMRLRNVKEPLTRGVYTTQILLPLLLEFWFRME